MSILTIHSRRHTASAFIALCAFTLMACISVMPLAAQTAVTDGAPQVIDLSRVLEVPEDAPTVEVAVPEETIEPVERSVEVEDETLLTTPEYQRSLTSDETAALTADVLLPLQSKNATLNGIVRITGEVQSEDFFVDLPVANSAQELVLSYRIAINVLPEQSQLHIRVNGTDLEPVRPTAFDGFEQLILPSSLLVAGRNEITVTAYQSHRIFCGPEATFAIWTEIDTNISGVRLARTELPVSPQGLRMALAAQVAVSGSLPTRFLENTSDRFLEDLAPRLAGLRDGSPVQLDQQPVYGVLNGPPQISRIIVLAGDGAPYAEVRRGSDDAIVLVLTEGLDGSMPDLNEVLPLPGVVQNTSLLTPGKTTTLRDLSFTQTEAFNRYSEQEVKFGLPDDWLVLASQKALLRLDYGFADGLPKSAILLVKMNETTVGLLPLDRNGGKTLPTLEIDFPARLLVPGANALTFAAIIPGDPPEMHCQPLSGPLLTIGAQSTILVPPSPKMRMAGLDRVMIAMRPDQVRTETDSVGSGDAAYTLKATISAALRPVSETETIDGASLTVAYGVGLGPLDLEDLEITRRDLARLIPSERPNVPIVPATQDADRGGVIDGLRTYYLNAAAWLGNLAVPGDGPLKPWLEDRQAEAVLFIPRDEEPEKLWLLVSPFAQPGRVAAILAQARMSPHGPKGRFAVLTPDGKWQNWRTTRTAPVLLEPLSVANFREVAGNYASWSPLYFCLVLMGLTFLSALVALVFIVTTRGIRRK